MNKNQVMKLHGAIENIESTALGKLSPPVWKYETKYNDKCDNKPIVAKILTVLILSSSETMYLGRYLTRNNIMPKTTIHHKNVNQSYAGPEVTKPSTNIFMSFSPLWGEE